MSWIMFATPLVLDEAYWGQYPTHCLWGTKMCWFERRWLKPLCVSNQIEIIVQTGHLIWYVLNCCGKSWQIFVFGFCFLPKIFKPTRRTCTIDHSWNKMVGTNHSHNFTERTIMKEQKWHHKSDRFSQEQSNMFTKVWFLIVPHCSFFETYLMVVRLLLQAEEERYKVGHAKNGLRLSSYMANESQSLSLWSKKCYKFWIQKRKVQMSSDFSESILPDSRIGSDRPARRGAQGAREAADSPTGRETLEGERYRAYIGMFKT